MSKYLQLVCCLSLLGVSGCEMALEPYDGKPAEQALDTFEGLQAATMGNYHNLVGDAGDYTSFIKVLMYVNEFPSDNVSLSGTTTDPLYYVYNYAHFPNMGYTSDFWREDYQLIYGANQVIENIGEDASAERSQLAGENFFLRALAHFQLVNVFGRPYTQGRDNPGIPIVGSTRQGQELLPRNSVGEVYDFVTEDLQKAADLMSIAQPGGRASREVAWALLSRVYLYEGENQRAIDYATRVIDSGRYRLLDTETFKRFNELAPESNPEVIFAVKHTQADDHEWGAPGSMYYQSPGGVGWGEMYVSQSYRELLDRYPEDARHAFVVPGYQRDAGGNVILDAHGDPILAERNGYPKYFMTKFSNQEGMVTLSSPAILRMAEMYLNRAEAEAKLGQDAAAIADVNVIRRRAGLSGDALYSVGDLKGHSSVLDVVLEERRLELAFEGHRKYDVFRNNRSLVRTYPGTHLNPTHPGVDMTAGTQTISPDHPRVVFFIPENEVSLNPNLIQNP